MPLYVYRCEVCGSEFEQKRSFSEAEVTPPCPVCRSEQTRKQISVFATAAGGNTASTQSAGGCSSSGSRFR